MAIKAQLQPHDGQRSSPRRALRLDTSGRLADGLAANVTVHNISAAGLLLQTDLALATGEALAIELPEAGLVDAVIVWRSEQLYGCAFEQSLGHAALAATQLRAGGAPDPLVPALAVGLDIVGPAFGQRLHHLRRERGLTLADVAGAIGVSKPTVWAWEKGKARPLPERVSAIAAALGVSPEALQDAATTNSGTSALIADCRERIARACNLAPSAVRIMIEL